MNDLQNITFCKSKLLYCHLRIIYGDRISKYDLNQTDEFVAGH
jgi:hypothetical protein